MHVPCQARGQASCHNVRVRTSAIQCALMPTKRRVSCTLGGLHALLDHLAERTRVVQVWERLVRRHRDMQEAAQGLPALLHVVDQHPLGWDAVLDLLDMSLEDADRAL